MARKRKAKYGLRAGLGEIVARNFLAYAMFPNGKAYVDGLRKFTSDAEKVNKYRRTIISYFDALVTYLSLHPFAFKRALEPVYSEIKRMAEERVPPPPPVPERPPRIVEATV